MVRDESRSDSVEKWRSLGERRRFEKNWKSDGGAEKRWERKKILRFAMN